MRVNCDLLLVNVGRQPIHGVVVLVRLVPVHYVIAYVASRRFLEQAVARDRVLASESGQVRIPDWHILLLLLFHCAAALFMVRITRIVALL